MPALVIPMNFQDSFSLARWEGLFQALRCGIKLVSGLSSDSCATGASWFLVGRLFPWLYCAC